MTNKIEYIKEIFKELGLEEIKYKDKDFEIEMKKNSSVNIIRDDSEHKIINKEVKETENSSGFYKVKCPLVGIYYDKPSPEENSYVSIEKRVKKGDVLCVVEAMKMFNEVKSPVDGIIRKINYSSENLVSVDDILFEIEE